MKSERIIFGLAAVALIGAVICCLSIFLTPKHLPEEEEVAEEQPETEEEIMQKEAEAEILRFKENYGLEITMEDMLDQIRIRRKYEAVYGRSYELEEVFMVNIPEDDTEWDPGDIEYSDTIEKIQKYIKLYDIDESRYVSMTPQEELNALEVEYGPLATEENDTQSLDTEEKAASLEQSEEGERMSESEADAPLNQSGTDAVIQSDDMNISDASNIQDTQEAENE